MKEVIDTIIRSANGSDLDVIARVWHESASHMDGASTLMPSCSELRDRIDVELSSTWRLYVATRNGRIVGMLAIKPAEAVLDQIFILPAEQRKGVGTILLNWAKQKMPNGFTLRMASSNDRASRFYRKEGLKLLGEGSHPQSGMPVQYYGWNADNALSSAGG